MQFRRKPIDAKSEKELITNLITQDRFAKEIIPILKIELLRVPYSQTIAKWCIEYFKKYEKAPQETIQDIFSSKIKMEQVEESQLIATFLEELSNKHETKESVNVPYEIEKAEKYLRTREVEMSKEDIDMALLNDDIDGAESVFSNFKRNVRPQTKGIDAFDPKLVKSVFDSLEDNNIYTLPGQLGKLIGPLCRNDFVLLEGPRGVSKSWILLQILVWIAMKGYKVLLLTTEMSEIEVRERLLQLILGETIRPERVEVPILSCRKINNCRKENKRNDFCSFCNNTFEYQDFDPFVDYFSSNKKGLDFSRSYKKVESLRKLMRGGEFKILYLPSRSASILDFENHLNNMEYYDGFVPSIIGTDHLNRMKPINSYKEGRHSVNDTWENAIGIAQKRNQLWINVTHTNKETIKRGIREGDTSEDIRIENMATKIIAVHATDNEREAQICKIRMTKQRREKYVVKKGLTVLQCISIGKPIIDSY